MPSSARKKKNSGRQQLAGKIRTKRSSDTFAVLRSHQSTDGTYIFRCRHCGAHFFFNDTATTEIYTLALHDALPSSPVAPSIASSTVGPAARNASSKPRAPTTRSEEHTSELQSPDQLVCRLLLEKKKKQRTQLLPCKKKTYKTIIHA